MEIQAVVDRAEHTARAVTDELRAEMARQRRTAADLANALGITAHTAGRKLNGESTFSLIELARAAGWLGVTVSTLTDRAERRTREALA